jgi:hypothetical protein
MTRFVTVNLQCDWPECPVIAEEGDGTVIAVTLGIDNRQPKEFLVCKPHRDQLNETLVPLMQAGVKVEAKKTRKTVGPAGNVSGTSVDGPSSSSSSSSSSGSASSEEEPGIVCLEDPCEREGRPVKSNVGLAQHVIRSHGYANLNEYKQAHGLE